jgi:hypothetical protein
MHGDGMGRQRVMRRFDFTIIRRRVERGRYYWSLNQVLRAQGTRDFTILWIRQNCVILALLLLHSIFVLFNLIFFVFIQWLKKWILSWTVCPCSIEMPICSLVYLTLCSLWPTLKRVIIRTFESHTVWGSKKSVSELFWIAEGLCFGRYWRWKSWEAPYEAKGREWQWPDFGLCIVHRTNLFPRLDPLALCFFWVPCYIPLMIPVTFLLLFRLCFSG